MNADHQYYQRLKETRELCDELTTRKTELITETQKIFSTTPDTIIMMMFGIIDCGILDDYILEQTKK